MEEYLNEYLSLIDNEFTNTNVNYTADFNELFCSTEAESTYFDELDITFWYVIYFYV